MDVKIILDNKNLGMVKFDLNSKIHALKEYGELVLKHYKLPIDNYIVDIYLNKSTKLDMSQITHDLIIKPYKHLFIDPYIHIYTSNEKTKLENLRKDEITYMGLFMDPQTILNLAKVNKRFNQIFNDKFWENKTRHDYPGFLKEKETWKEEYFFLYNLKKRIYQDVKPILKEVHPEFNISEEAVNLIADLLEPIIYPLMMIRGNNPEFDHKIMESAIKNAIPGQLGKHAWSEYKRPTTLIKRYDPNTIGRVIEYLIAELTELGGNYARDLRRDTIQTLDVYTSIYTDEELFKLFYDYLPAFPFNLDTAPNQKEVFDDIEITEEYKEGLHKLKTLLNRYLLFRHGNMDNTLKDIVAKSRKIQPIGPLTLETLLETVLTDKHLNTIMNEYKQSNL